MTDAYFEEVKLHLTEEEIVELCFFVGTYNTYHRFNTVIDLKPNDGENLVISHVPGYRPAGQAQGSAQNPKSGQARA